MDAERIAEKVGRWALAEDTEYQKFFQKKLKEHGVSSPAELKGDKKKKFFDEVDAEYDAENETD